jgi:hypothetical protein
MPPSRANRSSMQRAVGEISDAVRRNLDPLLPSAARDAVQAIESDAEVPIPIKKSVRRLLVDQRQFAHAFFAALDSEVAQGIDHLADAGRDQDRHATKSTGLDALSLVDYDQMEETMMFDRLAARIRNAADSSFTPLNQRIATIIGVPALNDRENPFYPLRFCRALGAAIDKLGFAGEERQVVLKAFDASMLTPLVGLYKQLNTDLERRGVQEAAAASGFKNTGFRNTVMDAGGRNTRGGAAGIGSMTGATAEQLLTALYQRMQYSSGHHGAAAGMPATPAMPALPAHPGAMSASPPMFERIESIHPPTSGITGNGSTGVPVAPGTPVQFASIEPGLLASINEVQRLNALATMSGSGGAAAAMISERDGQHLRQHVADRATRQIDKLTIELVGMLFDRIHQDKHVPAEIKTALSRLQFPIMKVALADSELFVSPVQPARKLMDRIASTAVGWQPEGEDNVRYLSEVNKAIGSIVVAINEGPSIFEKALDQFEKYLADERVRDDDPVTRAKRALEEAETREVMAINAAIGVRRAFDGVQVESYLKDFLLGPWVMVLVAATLRERTQPEYSKKFRDAVSDLVWSVQPKINPDDRKRLVKTIPAVLSTLREGVQLIDLPPAQTQEFFGRLMGSHAQAVKALEVAYGTGAPMDTAAFKRRIEEVEIVEPPAPQVDQNEQLTITPEVIRSAVAANNAEVNMLDAPLTVAPEEMIPVEELSDQQIDAMIEGWQRGAWFDLHTGEQTERVRLRWISPRRNFYLFTSANTGKAHSLAPVVLRGYIRAGRIRSAEGAPLFERVVGGMMRELQTEGTAQPA